VGAAVRAIERARRLGDRFLRDAGTTFRETRVALALSQAHVAGAAGISRTRYGRIEASRVTTLTILEFTSVAAVLGLDPAVRLYPGGTPVRDSGHASKIRGFVANTRAPLIQRTEVPLPVQGDRTELRAWDLVLVGGQERTTAEFEMRLADVQALLRRIGMKRRDDPSEHFVLVVADTRTNRRVLAEYGELFTDLPRLSTARVLAALRGGRHPGSGLVLF
jgi:transcriptional regulator with XRE-family HTH domain